MSSASLPPPVLDPSLSKLSAGSDQRRLKKLVFSVGSWKRSTFWISSKVLSSGESPPCTQKYLKSSQILSGFYSEMASRYKAFNLPFVQEVKNCGERHGIEDLHGWFVNLVRVFDLTFSLETEMLRHASALVISSQQNNLFRVQEFEGKKVNKDLHAKVTAVHIIAQENIVWRFYGSAWN